MNVEEIRAQNEKLRLHMLSLADPASWRRTEGQIAESLAAYEADGRLPGIDTVYLIGHGTSLATSMNAEFLFTRIAGVSARAIAAYQMAAYPEEFLKRPENTLVVGISCSGNTKSVVGGLEAAKRLGARTMCISGGGEIGMARVADYRVRVHAEIEREADVSAYSVSHLFILLGAFHAAILLGRLRGVLDGAGAAYWEEQWRELRAGLKCLPELYERMDGIVDDYLAKGLHNLVVLGTGPNLGTAQEGALKICEFSWIFSAAEELEDFAHGRFREVDGKIPLFIVAPGEKTCAKTMDLLAGCQIATTPAVIFTERDDEAMARMAAHVVRMPAVREECLTPFLYVFPMWFFGFHIRRREEKLVGEKRFGLLATDIDYRAYLGRGDH